jgi:5-methylcytosine-specific restriction endonuclease McrA
MMLSPIVQSAFYSWLEKQQKRNDPIGDLARDAKKDQHFPVTQTDLELLHCHLIHTNASCEAHCALDEAFREYSSPKSIRATLSPKLRFQIFKRDNYHCQICGASADNGARLEVDHKIPVSNGGTNDIENLWALCFECNRGKGIQEIQPTVTPYKRLKGIALLHPSTCLLVRKRTLHMLISAYS